MNFSWFKKSKLFFWTIEILAVVLILFVLLKMNFIFAPLGVMASTLFMPLLISGFLFYMFKPLVQFLEKRKIPRLLSVIFIFITFIVLLALAVIKIGPVLVNEVTQLAKSFPNYWANFENWLGQVTNNTVFQQIDIKSEMEKANLSVPKVMNVILNGITSSISAIVGFVGSFVVVLLTVPFILFYMFKDGHHFMGAVEKFFPSFVREDVKKIIREMNKTLSTYISSQVLDCLFVGIFTFIGYLITGQPYALLFAFIAGATNIIPYLGPFIGAAPAIIVALFTSPLQAFLVVVVVLIVQQIDGNVLQPLIMGRTLKIHPLTIIIILLVAGNLAGIWGMILGVPLFAVVKTIVINVNKMIQLRRASESASSTPQKKEGSQ